MIYTSIRFAAMTALKPPFHGFDPDQTIDRFASLEGNRWIELWAEALGLSLDRVLTLLVTAYLHMHSRPFHFVFGTSYRFTYRTYRVCFNSEQVIKSTSASVHVPQEPIWNRKLTKYIFVINRTSEERRLTLNNKKTTFMSITKSQQFISKREVSIKTVTVNKITYVPIMTYGFESWAMTQKKTSTQQTAGMRFLRRFLILVCIYIYIYITLIMFWGHWFSSYFSE